MRGIVLQMPFSTCSRHRLFQRLCALVLKCLKEGEGTLPGARELSIRHSEKQSESIARELRNIKTLPELLLTNNMHSRDVDDI